MPKRNRKKKIKFNIWKLLRNLILLTVVIISFTLAITYLPQYFDKIYSGLISTLSYLIEFAVSLPGLLKSYIPSMITWVFGEWPGGIMVILLLSFIIHYLFTGRVSIISLWVLLLFIFLQGFSGFFHPQFRIFREPSPWVGYLGVYLFQTLAIPLGEWLALFIYLLASLIMMVLVMVFYKKRPRTLVIREPIEQVPLVKTETKKVHTPQNEGTAGEYVLPTTNLLKTHPVKIETINKERLSSVLQDTMQSFGIAGSVEKIISGPTILHVEVKLEKGTRVKEVKSISDELSMALGVSLIRIEAPLPGKPDMLAIEVPRERRSLVTVKEILQSNDFQNSSLQIPLVLGREVTGQIIIDDLRNAPHLLIGGATGTGKTICLHSIITGMLYRFTPANLKLVLIDPKRVEFSIYSELPHLLTPVVTEIGTAIKILKLMTREMDNRFRMLGEKRVRDITGYNKVCSPEEKMPFIVVVIDELADLMMQMAKDAEKYIVRLAQKARATGIHLIIATQRPSAEVVTGLIKTNFPNRIALAVPSQIDSRVIIDRPGAEKLLGKGDLLYLTQDAIRPRRIQGAFMDEDEVAAVVNNWSKQVKEPPEYLIPEDDDLLEENNQFEYDEEDPLLEEITGFVLTLDFISVSLLQRRFKLGYGRAARIVDELEARGLVGPLEGNKKRKVLVGKRKESHPFRI
ncbi:MAG: DNA translocase SpoIIIE [candidate division WS2 bacterium]|uniref:DNA translocase SpoIIIE n=1 Tax=Psychracetigena formicireducens TaxID=2986056 RepID=A0A9E2F476_PSYF1|nr:DNA translocase SpoIIIE [Candidatus Psychracetigena formicireducens]